MTNNSLSVWLPLIILSAGQFLMLLDTTVMNVSISQLVIDLHTDVTKIQAVITVYALVMAAFMLVGGKIGDIIGRKRTFALGLVVYGAGSAVTSIAPNVGILLLGWSFLEGLGAALILPALTALLAENYHGTKRALAYGMIGAISGLAIAAGPLIGGFFTTYLSWRYVFAGEVLVALAIILSMRFIKDSKRIKGVRLDFVGTILSALGLGLTVFGILQISDWGFISPKNSPITPLGFSLVPFLIIGGLVILVLLYLWEESREKSEKPVLFKISLLKNMPVRASLLSILFQFLVTAGIFFLLPLYLQIVLGFDALQTGATMLPISIALILTSIVGTRLIKRFSPRTVVQLGMALLLIGTIVMLASLNYHIKGTGFMLSLFLAGAGLGFMNSQLSNSIQSSVSQEDRSEAGGLQYTFQNIGNSVGTALAGTILITGLLNSYVTLISNDPAISKTISSQASTALKNNIEFVTTEQAEKAIAKTDVDQQQANALIKDYQTAQLDALRKALGILALAAIIGIWFTKNLPKKYLTG